MLRELDADGKGAPPEACRVLDLAQTFGRTHPSDRIRLVALDAQAGVLGMAERDELWRRAEGSGRGLVAREATHRRTALDRV